MSSDPLGFFAGDLSSSESEEGEEGGRTGEREGEEGEGGHQQENGGDKLPSPATLFATVGRPAFLNDSDHVSINWDKFVRRLSPSPEENIHQRDQYAAIPSPTSSVGSEISAAPIKYAHTPIDPQHETFSTSEELPPSSSSSSSGGKRANTDTNEDLSKKKQKVETFRQKEKRKRDLGMTSRGKSYVEEEKRILRQQFSGSGE